MRQYQHGAIPKDDGDYAYDHGQKFSTYKINGIQWVEYKSTGKNTSYFRGIKDNTIFEIGSQVYSPDQVKGYLKTFSSL